MKVYKSKLIDENNIKKTYKLGLREFCILLIVSLLCNQALYATDKSEHINLSLIHISEPTRRS